jgi:hypothetical protein
LTGIKEEGACQFHSEKISHHEWSRKLRGEGEARGEITLENSPKVFSK